MMQSGEDDGRRTELVLFGLAPDELENIWILMNEKQCCRRQG